MCINPGSRAYWHEKTRISCYGKLMKPHECSHQVSFTKCLLVTNPHNYPCPHCQKRLTLDKTGRRFLWAIVVSAVLYGSVVGMMSFLFVLEGASMPKVLLFNLSGLVLGTCLLIPIPYFAWTRSSFVERSKLNRIRQSVQRRNASGKVPFRYRLILSSSNS